MRIVIAGASGFIGRYLVAAFEGSGDSVAHVGRSSPDARWGDTAAITALVDGADVLINLAGKSVNCRYNARNRAEILRSRVETTSELGRAIAAAAHPPALWINSSTATIYRHAEDRAQTESTGELGTGFSVGIAKAWEESFFAAVLPATLPAARLVALPATRRVALRIAIVLGDGSVMPPLIRLTRFGFGGAQLDGRWFSTASRRAAGTFHEFRARAGRQRFSWVHIADVLGVIRFVIDHREIDGVVNVASPNPTDSRGFMGMLRTVLRVPFAIPTPRFILELGSIAIRTETELVLKSRWVTPERLLAAGYQFEYPELEPALRQIVHR